MANLYEFLKKFTTKTYIQSIMKTTLLLSHILLHLISFFLLDKHPQDKKNIFIHRHHVFLSQKMCTKALKMRETLRFGGRRKHLRDGKDVEIIQNVLN